MLLVQYVQYKNVSKEPSNFIKKKPKCMFIIQWKLERVSQFPGLLLQLIIENDLLIQLKTVKIIKNLNEISEYA